jgi:hypothetical protein
MAAIDAMAGVVSGAGGVDTIYERKRLDTL